MNTYRAIQPLVFSLTNKDAEVAHHWGLRFLQKVGDIEFLRNRTSRRWCINDQRLKQTFHNLIFNNPIGLAAGFSKNGEALAGIAAHGFGFIEVGTVPNLAQPGNPRPRLFRLPNDKCLINRMGFNSEGADTVCNRLGSLTDGNLPVLPLGINLGKSKVVDESDINAVVGDYIDAQRKLLPFADYMVVNVSSPNTPGLRTFQNASKLRQLLGPITEESVILAEKYLRPVPPLFVKFSFDIELSALEDAIAVVLNYTQGMIGFNTTTSRDGVTDSKKCEQGGLSGKLLAERSLRLHEHLAHHLPSDFLRIAVGGVDPTNVTEFLKHAHLVQLLTSWVYWGPSVAHDCNQSILRQMERRGLEALPQLRFLQKSGITM